MKDLFYQFVRKLEGMGETDHKAVFIDGTKLESRAGRYTFVWRKSVEKQALLERWERTVEEGRSSYSKTDPDATFMRMKEDHMRNGQLKPEYNVQIAVNSEYITGLEAFSDRTDVRTLRPMLDTLSRRHQTRYEEVMADAGYESLKNYLYLE